MLVAQKVREGDLAVRLTEIPGNVDGGCRAGNQGGQTGAERTHAEGIDGDGITGDVDDVHDHARAQRAPASAHGPQQGRTGIVHGQEREGERGHQEIPERRLHDVRLNAAKDGGEEEGAQGKADDGKDPGKEQGNIVELAGGGLCNPEIAVPEILGRDDSTAGGQGAEELNEQDIDGIDKGNTADRSFTAGRNHDRVHHAHEHDQQLLKEERQQEGLKIFFGEHSNPSLSQDERLREQGMERTVLHQPKRAASGT